MDISNPAIKDKWQECVVETLRRWHMLLLTLLSLVVTWTPLHVHSQEVTLSSESPQLEELLDEIKEFEFDELAEVEIVESKEISEADRTPVPAVVAPRPSSIPSSVPSPVTRESITGLTSELVLALYKSGVLELRSSPSRVSIGNDSIADILILRGNQVHVLGKALGSTNVVFWDSNDHIFATINIEVTHDLASLKKKLFQMMPSETIRMYSAQENIVLEGEVSSASNLNAAVKIAEAYLPECISSGNSGNQDQSSGGDEATSNAESCEKAEVVNLMSVGGSQQVMLEVKIAEVSRTLRRIWDPKLHFIDFTSPTRFGAVTDGLSLPEVLVDGENVPFAPGGVANGALPIIGPVQREFSPNTQSFADNGLFFSDLTGNTLFSAAIEVSKQNGLTKILAEPTLTTLTGRTAEFHSGGEFPIVTTTFQGTNVIYEEFGVSVKFLPTILGSTINIDIEVEVSEIDESQSQTIATTDSTGAFSFPFLTSRSVSNTVELSNGQTLGIAGLIQDDVTEVSSKLPGLGDIPILGSLFTSREFVSGQTELIVFVTPHLAKPIAPDKIRLPTDSFVPPNDVEFYLLGRMESLNAPEPMDRSTRFDPGFDGVTFGHDL